MKVWNKHIYLDLYFRFTVVKENCQLSTSVRCPSAWKRNRHTVLVNCIDVYTEVGHSELNGVMDKEVFEGCFKGRLMFRGGKGKYLDKWRESINQE